MPNAADYKAKPVLARQKDSLEYVRYSKGPIPGFVFLLLFLSVAAFGDLDSEPVHSSPESAQSTIKPDTINQNASDEDRSDQEVSLEEQAALEFFHEHWRKASNFNPIIARNYHPKARIHTTRIQSSGEKRFMEVSGKQWSDLMPMMMAMARQAGDKQYLSQATIESSENGYRISAVRYSESRCYYDKNYYMVIAKEEERYYIVEEYMETRGENLCEKN